MLVRRCPLAATTRERGAMGSALTSTGTRARLVAAWPRGLCLDYANTRCWRGLPCPKEALQRPADLMAWCRHAGLGPGPARLRAAAAAGLFAEAIALREVIYRVFSARATGGLSLPADLSALNAALARTPPRAAIAPLGAASYAWRLEWPAAAFTGSAPELLA